MDTNKITGCAGFGNSKRWNRKKGRSEGKKEIKDGIHEEIVTSKNYVQHF
jgi:hypothetical protein